MTETPPLRRLLIANRAEIAIRIARTAASRGVETIAIYAEDDDRSLHVRRADDARALRGQGAAAYLDIDQVVTVAKDAGCDAIHPGYGFLSERAAFAEQCEQEGITFVGPASQTLADFGDKLRARELAAAAGVPVLRGAAGATLDDARAFFADLGADAAVMVKAVAGGGGRGMRIATSDDELSDAFTRCSSEAAAAFGDPSLYLEEFLPGARHIEVQLVGDGEAVSHLWDRDCSVQRARQKIIELAPAPGLPPEIRDALFEAAVAIGRAAGLRSLCTVEFLVGTSGAAPAFAFIEANARLQVEHTVTEAVTGLDLVSVQLDIAAGRTLSDLGLTQADVAEPTGHALQARVNLETMAGDGTARPSMGTITAYEPPAGAGIRVDGFGYSGYETSLRYDSLLAKVIAHAPRGSAADAASHAYRALSEFRVEGPATNIGFLQTLLRHPAVTSGEVHTRFVDDNIEELVGDAEHPRLYFDASPVATTTTTVGATIDATDPLAVLVHGKQERAGAAPAPRPGGPAPEGTTTLASPMQGTVISVAVQAGDRVEPGQEVIVIEAMKMEHVVTASSAGTIRAINVAAGATVGEGHPLAFVEVDADAGAGAVDHSRDIDLDHIRPDLAEVLDRHRRTLDEARPDAVERRRRFGQRTARENIDDLCDPGSFVEYGPLTLAARRRRNTLDELIEQTPADGLVMGLATINGDRFPEDRARAAVMAYDYTVLAGTQGAANHVKLDRMAELALRWRLPTVFFTEGGGGRPGDTEGGGGFIRGFEFWGRLSGAVPLVGISSGRCFAGNAAILGCCDVIIATEDSALGMGGPAMVEGGGLGVFRPEEIGPVDVMQRNGTIDILVADEAEGVKVAKQYLSYFQGPLADWTCADQRLLRHVIPENRVRAYDVRRVIELLADDDSVLELRPRFGLAMITALIRVEGRPVGVIANNPQHLGGAIDSDASDKAARFLQICEAFDIPVLSLSDTPGNMVGPEAEKTGLIRHCSRLFVIGANLTVPILSVILRKSYGLGAIAMTGGSYQAAMFCVSWPTGEFGGMGLEGSVKLGYRNELAAIEDPVERRATFDRMVERAYAAGKALVRASGTALDDVIDPADTRRWVVAALRSLPPAPVRTEKKLRWIDTW